MPAAIGTPVTATAATQSGHSTAGHRQRRRALRWPPLVSFGVATPPPKGKRMKRRDGYGCGGGGGVELHLAVGAPYLGALLDFETEFVRMVVQLNATIVPFGVIGENDLIVVNNIILHSCSADKTSKCFHIITMH
ncbi:uncharacterized protein LOC107303731 [Oryza brachyantha]|uniref:uncharacterized protein LOC107303731 n=1 Tax=Oryza brachyantha TaxID=4533 RepID=UPI001ADB6668|nr:uncharacterized protein LOC107303731 [Oryza brachyantha]